MGWFPDPPTPYGQANFVRSWVTEEKKDLQHWPQAAARKGHLDVVRLLAENCPDQVDHKSDGKIALHAAASAGQGNTYNYL